MKATSRPAVGSSGQHTNTARVQCFRKHYNARAAGSKADRKAIFVGQRCVGHVQAGVFFKSVRSSVHQLRRPPAWCLDVGSLDQAEALGAQRVELYDTETGNRYTASIRLIRGRGFDLDRGFGRQIALPLAFWQFQRPGGTSAQQLLFPW